MPKRMQRTASIIKSPLHTFRSCEKYVPADYYLYFKEHTLQLTAAVSKGDMTMTVVSTEGLLPGNVITCYEGSWVFQSQIKTVTDATHITLLGPIDYHFTTAAVIETGLWNAAVDGSVNPICFSIKAPPLSAMVIRTVHASMLDGVVMDDGKFGGITQLSNGIRFGIDDGWEKNLAVIVNNLGFSEIGFTTQYADKAPAGQYGFSAHRDILTTNGVDIHLNAGLSSQFQMWVRDDLTEITLFCITVAGYLKPIN